MISHDEQCGGGTVELRQIQHFVAVAEERHFTRAAQRSHIAQSALSSSVRALEEELGARLFARTTRQVRLTPAGRLFLDKARAVLAAAQEARDAVRDLAASRRGTLSIGTVQSLPSFLELPALLARFHGACPGIEVHLCQGSTEQLAEKVRAGQLDLAILPICEPPPELSTALIACEDMVLICPPGHALAGRGSVALGALAGEAFVDFEPGWGSRQLVDCGFAQAGVERRIAFEVSELDTLLELVARGLGVALVPEAIAARHPQVAMVPLDGPEMCWELVVAHAKDGRSSPLAGPPRAFLDLLLERRASAAPEMAVP